ncbi:MAG: 4-hydroxy-3-methylbut-2-enyl diphosphate reductase [Elusimicrobia bacterium]|nr:4-hydroxy-3-methylbut-2-enyl diphosphate reductase [Elusimicrobiota bacterium]
MKINIIKSEYCDFCSGVKRSVNIARDSSKTEKVHTLGPIIHNPQVVDELKSAGIIPVDDIEKISGIRTILIRSHGITLEQESRLKEKGLNVIDATCPKVKKTHKIARDISDRHGMVIIIGAKSHPEVKGILSRAKEKGVVISSPEEAALMEDFEDAGVLVQTTFRSEKFFEIINVLARKSKVLEIYNTICEETVLRQNELKSIAGRVDLLIIVGGKNSSNTKRLYELGSEIVETYHIEVPEDINYSWLADREKVGIVSGASTPKSIIKKIEEKLELYNKKNLKKEVA